MILIQETRLRKRPTAVAPGVPGQACVPCGPHLPFAGVDAEPLIGRAPAHQGGCDSQQANCTPPGLKVDAERDDDRAQDDADAPVDWRGQSIAACCWPLAYRLGANCVRPDLQGLLL